MNILKFFSLLAVLPLCVFTMLLSGCALTNTALSNPVPVGGKPIAGVVHGGQQPISGAKVYLLAANPGGYGSGSLSLLTQAGTGNAPDNVGAYGLTGSGTSAGIFGLAGEYSCTNGFALGGSTSSAGTTLPGDEQVYLYVVGGDAGSGINSSIGMLAALGPCNAQYAISLTVNEITTVAAAYAFAGFAVDAAHISSSGTALALTGLRNAGLNAANLVNVSTGLPVANSTGITRPVATLYTIADILAACVNTVGGCSTLFQFTESGGATGTQATDTATAAINLAHNPWPTAAGVMALYSLVPSIGAPYSGAVSSQPNDFTVGLNLTGGGLSDPTSLAIDASGNAWTSNLTNKSASKFSSTGTALSPATGYTGGGIYGPNGVAIDLAGNAWVNSPFVVVELNPTGTPISGTSGYAGGGIDTPLSIAIDALANVWTVNESYPASISEFSSAGAAISPNTGYTGSCLDLPIAIAMDPSGTAWVANDGSSNICEFTNSGVLVSNPGYTGGSINPLSIALDEQGDIWTVSKTSVSELSKAGAVLSGSNGYTDGDASQFISLAIDGAGDVWVSHDDPAVGEFTNSGVLRSPSTGYMGGSTQSDTNHAIAIDGSGDVWVTTDKASNSIKELIGAATPVVTPVAANLVAPYFAPASRP